MENIKFSVIIPVYNTKKELPRCLDSILEQSYKDFEIVLVDDGSEDGSGQLCDAYTLKDERVKVIHKENGGASQARNTGIRNAIADYLLFVDSDDMWSYSNTLQEINDLIEKNQKVDLICFGTEIIDEDGKVEKTREIAKFSASSKEEIAKQLVYTNQYFSASYAKSLRREFCLENDLLFINGLLSEDIEWSGRVLVKCNSITTFCKVFYKRIRRKNESLTANIGKENIIDILNSIKMAVNEIEELQETQNLKNIYLEYWAYQYAMLFVLLRYLKKDEDYYSIVSRIEELKWLLKFDHVKKVKAVKMVTTVFGVKGTIRLIEMFYKVRGH